MFFFISKGLTRRNTLDIPPQDFHSLASHMLHCSEEIFAEAQKKPERE